MYLWIYVCVLSTDSIYIGLQNFKDVYMHVYLVNEIDIEQKYVCVPLYSTYLYKYICMSVDQDPVPRLNMPQMTKPNQFLLDTNSRVVSCDPSPSQ